MALEKEDEVIITRNLPQLAIGYYQFHFEAKGNVRLPSYAGSAWRGAFGHALKRAVCVTNMRQCEPCLLYRTCAYSYLFETPPPASAAKMRKYTAVPHPFVIQPDTTSDGKIYKLRLILFGRANSLLPYVIHAYERAAEKGLGMGRTPLALTEVSQACKLSGERWSVIYQPGASLQSLPALNPDIPTKSGHVKITLHTPMRLQRNGSLVTPSEFTFADLFSTLLRRISMLTYFHTDTPLETDFAELTRQARQITWQDTKLQWFDWARYSSRQETSMQMGGIVGELFLNTTSLDPFWPYLWLGQWTHAGKGTSMGLGHYRIDTVASLPDRHDAPNSGKL